MISSTPIQGGMPENRKNAVMAADIRFSQPDLEGAGFSPFLGVKPLGDDKKQMRKRVFYIVAGLLAVALLIAGGFLLAKFRRGHKQPYKVSLIYYRLNSEHWAVQKNVQEGFKKVVGQIVDPLMQIMAASIKGKIMATLKNIYHAEIELTDRQGKATRLSFGPKGLCEYAKPADADHLNYVGDRWFEAEEHPFGEFVFVKKTFLNQMGGFWKPGDYDLLTNNCVHFTRKFIKQVSTTGSSEGLDYPKKIYAGITSAQGLHRTIAAMVPNAVAQFDEISSQIVQQHMVDVEPLRTYHLKDAKAKSA